MNLAIIFPNFHCLQFALQNHLLLLADGICLLLLAKTFRFRVQLNLEKKRMGESNQYLAKTPGPKCFFVLLAFLLTTNALLRLSVPMGREYSNKDISRAL